MLAFASLCKCQPTLINAAALHCPLAASADVEFPICSTRLKQALHVVGHETVDTSATTAGLQPTPTDASAATAGDQQRLVQLRSSLLLLDKGLSYATDARPPHGKDLNHWCNIFLRGTLVTNQCEVAPDQMKDANASCFLLSRVQNAPDAPVTGGGSCCWRLGELRLIWLTAIMFN
jgi:hypothetical protein